jgi:hypothetical protein
MPPRVHPIAATHACAFCCGEATQHAQKIAQEIVRRRAIKFFFSLIGKNRESLQAI